MDLNEHPGFVRDGKMYALIHHREDWAEILSAFGELDLSVADELEAAIAGRLRGMRPVGLDFEYCQYIDSTILRVLVRANRTAADRLWLVVPPGARVRRIFEMTRLDQALAVVDSRDGLRDRLTLSH